MIKKKRKVSKDNFEFLSNFDIPEKFNNLIILDIKEIYKVNWSI